MKTNCWFCNEDSIVICEDSWTCPKCEQYNGFASDGDYNKEIPGQRSSSLDKIKTLSEEGLFDTSALVLCRACTANLTLKVRQLAAFTPISDDSYEEELELYRCYLEDVHRLCDVCERRVEAAVSSQDQMLRSKMTQQQLEKLQQLQQRVPSPLHEERATIFSRKPNATSVILIVCLGLALSRFFICLRLYTATVINSGLGSPTDNEGRLNSWMKWLVASVPAEYVIAIEDDVAHLGMALCTAGLFLLGKNSVYPEDALHLFLWLTSVVAATGLSLPLSELVNPTGSCGLGFALLTLCLAFVSCMRSRRPREILCLAFLRKTVPSPVTSPNKTKDLSSEDLTSAKQHESSLVDQSNMNDNSSLDDDDSPSIHDASVPVFEDLRQDLETFSLGLSRKTGSNSSIWSLPAVVKSSTHSTSNDDPNMTPDSTSDIDPHDPKGRRLLSPSRLGFVNFNSSSESRSPSPWSSLTTNDSVSVSPSQQPFNMTCHSQDSVLYNRQHNFDNNPLQYSTYRTHYNEDYTNVSSPNSGNVGILPYKNSKHNMNTEKSPHASHQANIDKSSQHFQLAPTTGLVEPAIDKSSDSTTRRRSQRIAMAGRKLKPWPLKKSFSCNNALDRKNIERVGASYQIQPLHGANLADLSESLDDPYNVFTTSDRRPLQECSRAEEASSNYHLPHRQNYSGGSSECRNELLSNMINNPSPAKIGQQFLDYRDSTKLPISTQNSQVSHKRNTQQVNCDLTKQSCSRQFICPNWSPTGLSSSPQSGFSDDEDMDVDVPWNSRQTDSLSENQSKSIFGVDATSRWMLLGVVIGASVTCNIFFVIQAWFQ